MEFYNANGIAPSGFSGVYGEVRAFFYQKAYNDSVNDTLSVLSINHADYPYNGGLFGFIGLAPYLENNAMREYNFLYQLKSRGIIDHMVASFYIVRDNSQPRTKFSVIKYGSMDESGYQGSMTYIRSQSLSKWRFTATDFTSENSVNGISGTRNLIIDPQSPYLYVPKEDFLRLALQIGRGNVGVWDCNRGNCSALNN